MTVAETPTFTRQAEKLFSEDEKVEIVNFLAEYPEAGEIIPDTGGVRKVRVPAKGREKRGGARVVYYFHDEDMPLYALFVYAKNQAEDLSPKGKQVAASLVAALKQHARRRK